MGTGPAGPDGPPVGAAGGGAARRCPACGGRLGPPVSGDVHCFVTCDACGERFELDDPRLAEPAARERVRRPATSG